LLLLASFTLAEIGLNEMLICEKLGDALVLELCLVYSESHRQFLIEGLGKGDKLFLWHEGELRAVVDIELGVPHLKLNDVVVGLMFSFLSANLNSGLGFVSFPAATAALLIVLPLVVLLLLLR